MSVATKLEIVITEKPLYATPTGLKVGNKGKVQSPSLIYRELPKGMARRLRKILRASGKAQWAGMSRR